MIGIVIEFSLPRKSCVTGNIFNKNFHFVFPFPLELIGRFFFFFVFILKIVDHSRQSPELSVNIFTEKVGHLPVVKSHSDLIVLHNVLVPIVQITTS